jgi:hypothetical protein
MIYNMLAMVAAVNQHVSPLKIIVGLEHLQPLAPPTAKPDWTKLRREERRTSSRLPR